MESSLRQLAPELGAKYAAGSTLQEIGDYYGVTREWVRQILSEELGITGKDGGQAKRSKAKARAAGTRKDQRNIRRYGMTAEQYRESNGHLDATGARPIYRYTKQRCHAVRRGIEWNLTFAEWWSIWFESGHWLERGRGVDGYVMARQSDFISPRCSSA